MNAEGSTLKLWLMGNNTNDYLIQLFYIISHTGRTQGGVCK